jgi:hypothetical protein
LQLEAVRKVIYNFRNLRKSVKFCVISVLFLKKTYFLDRLAGDELLFMYFDK